MLIGFPSDGCQDLHNLTLVAIVVILSANFVMNADRLVRLLLIILADE
jgi:hypothetical protein